VSLAETPEAKLPAGKPIRHAELHTARDAHTCDLCGSDDRMVIGRIGRDFRPLVTVVCRNCGLMRHDPMPSEQAQREYYEKNYRLSYKGAAEPRERDYRRDRQRAEARLELLAPVLKPGMRILDVGSGSGTFMLLARERGYDVHGIEPDVNYAKRLREKFNLPVHSGPWDTAELPEGAYDLVTMHHVLEHVRRPTAAIQQIHRWAADGAHFYLSVPNIKNPNASPFNRNQPAHLYGFSNETLTMVALKAGFALADVPNTGNTDLVFRKLPAPPENWFIYPQHGAEMVKFFNDHTFVKYLLRPVAYRRFVQQIKRGLFGR